MTSHAPEPRSSDALVEATGRDYAAWFAALDEWSPPGRPYREIVEWLTRQGVSDWWAQKLIVEYEQSRGVREKGARAGGTFAGGASKTIHVPAETVFESFTDAESRRKWLSEPELSERTSRPHRSVRFDARDGSRVNVTFDAKDADRTVVAVEQVRLPDTDSAERAKATWRERLSVLKQLLED
ncbi:hypothetical protein MU582_00935 [Nocardioidaceae bacterium SCSIO 66511]|nr:hypothetical protein MU582_00935 [Nocardioidaceae bacterium SCSIO 66511]